MKTFYKYAAFAAAALAGLCACSSDDDAAETGSGLQPVAQPQIIVSDLTTTGFTLRWEAVDDAGSYVYTFDGGSETSTTGCRLEFNSLERQKEYVVAVKACPRDPAEYTESPFTYIHVLTDDLEQLPQPKITLGSAYASKTVISWTEVPEAELYEFSVDGGEVSTTRNRTVILSKLDKGRTYSFSVRAMTSDATRFTNSEAAQLSFVTSDADVPPLVIAPTTIISDAVAFDIYASSDETYYYEILPATTFAKYSPEELMTAFQTYIVEYAKKQGISLQLAMASMLKSGTQSLQMTGLTPELSYVIFAFGMDLRGNITSNLSSTQFKTTADGYSAGPNYGGSDWFTQRFYITNAYLALTGYGWTNSVWTHWKGDDVTDVRYRTLTTKLFNQVFSDPYDRQAIAAFLKDPNYGVQFNPELLSATVNSADGYNGLTEGVSAGTSYTLLTLATSSSGAETVCVNSVTTKTSTAAAAWFAAAASTNANYGPTHNTVAGVMKGIDIATVRYAIFKQSALANVSTDNYPAVIEEFGHDLKEEYLPYINGNGFAILFTGENGVTPETTYVFMATATNTVGDKVTKWGSATTSAAPDAARAKAQAATRTDEPLRSPAGKPIANPEKFIYPMESVQLPAGAKPEGDLWTIIHNTHNIK